MYCTLHISVHGNRVKPQSNSVATIFHSHSQRHSKHWLPSVFKGCHHQAILMTDKNGFALSAHRIMYSCRVSGMSGPAFGTIPHVSSSVCFLERNSALVFGIVLIWEEKIYSIHLKRIRNMKIAKHLLMLNMSNHATSTTHKTRHLIGCSSVLLIWNQILEMVAIIGLV